jgi:hypothetical protein
MYEMVEPLILRCADSARQGPSDRDAAWRAWPREQLWLWRDLSPSPVRARTRSVLADAISTLLAAEIEGIAALAEADEPGAALRLTARLLRRQADRLGWQMARDLAASALLLAVIEHRDVRAALEFVMFVHSGDAGSTAGTRFDSGRYPPPFDRPRPLRARLRRQAGLALSLIVASYPTWGRAIENLGQLRDGDPLAGLTASGQRPNASGVASAISIRRHGRARMPSHTKGSSPASVPNGRGSSSSRPA